MFRNLSFESLGVIGRQSEMIELALSYGFSGMDLDLAQFVRKAEAHGIEHAGRFIRSAKIKIGTCDLPIRWDGDALSYREEMTKLKKVAEIAETIGVYGCRAVLPPVSEEKPYHEAFEIHRQRLAEVAEILSSHDIKLGLDFMAPAYHREGGQFPFVSNPEPLITMAKQINTANIGVVVDPWNWLVGGGNMQMLGELSGRQVVAFRMADLPEDANFAEIDEKDRRFPGSTGQIDFSAVLKQLSDMGYDGPVSAAPSPQRNTGKTRENIVKQCAEALDQLWTDAGLEPEDRTVRSLVDPDDIEGSTAALEAISED